MALFAVMVLLTVPYSWSDSKGKRVVPPLVVGRIDPFQLQRINPDLLTLAAWGDRLNCSAVQHRDCESEAAEMAEVARRVFATWALTWTAFTVFVGAVMRGATRLHRVTVPMR